MSVMPERLMLAPSGERVGWGEIIEDLRSLNVATANNLTCIFALCFGLHLYKQVSLKRPVPAYLFCAPPDKISVGFLEAQTLAFYREMSRTSNVTAAFEATLGGVMQSFHCQGLFLQSLLHPAPHTDGCRSRLTALRYEPRPSPKQIELGSCPASSNAARRLASSVTPHCPSEHDSPTAAHAAVHDEP